MNILNSPEGRALGITKANLDTASQKPLQEVIKRVNAITSEPLSPSTPVTSGSQAAINRRNAIHLGSFDKLYNEFIELYTKLKANSANPSTKITALESDYYKLQKTKNEIMNVYNLINSSNISVRGRSTINSKKADINSKLSEIRRNIKERQRAIPIGRSVPINPLKELYRQTTIGPDTPTGVHNSPIRITNKNIDPLDNGSLAALFGEDTQPVPPAPVRAPMRWAQPGRPPAASAVPPAPVRAPPPPPGAPSRQWPPAGPIRLPGRNTRSIAPLPKVAPPHIPSVSANPPQKNTRKNSNVLNNLANNRQRAKELILNSILGTQPVVTKMYQNTRRNGNMNTLEEQSVPVQMHNNNLTKKALKTLNNIESGIGGTNQTPNQTPPVSPNSEESDEELLKKMHNTVRQIENAVSGKPATPQQPEQYIKLANGTTYKFIEIIDDTVRAKELNRGTKTWGKVVELTGEDLEGSTEVRCPQPQAGGRRTRRRKAQRKHRKTRRA